MNAKKLKTTWSNNHNIETWFMKQQQNNNKQIRRENQGIQNTKGKRRKKGLRKQQPKNSKTSENSVLNITLELLKQNQFMDQNNTNVPN